MDTIVRSTIRTAARTISGSAYVVLGADAVRAPAGRVEVAAPTLAALALAGSLVPTTLAGHAFWKVDDPAGRKQQSVQFLKNSAMIGGLLAIAADPAPQPSQVSP